MSFQQDGGICYNRLAVKQDGKQEIALGDAAAAALVNRKTTGKAEAAVQEDASRYCPVCSQRLESLRCKLVCGVCGYYMSCADYY